MFHFRKPCEVPRRRCREYLRHGLLILSRNRIVIEEEISAHILSDSLSCLLCPLMVFRSMVHNKIHTHIDILLMASRRQALQVLHGSKLFLHFAEIRHGVAAVRTPFHRIKERHQMDVIYITLFEILKLRFHALHIPGKIIDVEHHAQHIILLIPVRTCLPVLVDFLQIIVTLLIETVKIVAQLCKHGAVAV